MKQEVVKANAVEDKVKIECLETAMKTKDEMKYNKLKILKAVKTIETKNKFKSNYNLKTHVILIYCDPLLLFSMVMDKIYIAWLC